MTDMDRIIALLTAIDNRLARVERALMPPAYKLVPPAPEVAMRDVLTRVHPTDGTGANRVVPFRDRPYREGWP